MSERVHRRASFSQDGTTVTVKSGDEIRSYDVSQYTAEVRRVLLQVGAWTLLRSSKDADQMHADLVSGKVPEFNGHAGAERGPSDLQRAVATVLVKQTKRAPEPLTPEAALTIALGKSGRELMKYLRSPDVMIEYQKITGGKSASVTELLGEGVSA